MHKPRSLMIKIMFSSAPDIRNCSRAKVATRQACVCYFIIGIRNLNPSASGGCSLECDKSPFSPQMLLKYILLCSQEHRGQKYEL